ncbi:hypothetical protein POM88_000135 [Heracleum sosnowskyi]|uniref:SURP motif domain-containing protein n=1 Tax=Heracleum sosnowskyi TaxID=360622 RepID=A0AAD8N3Q0_9APIA|nr:hypothetical protein POM88_000135 [Heracleum sosnowskyi]
MFSVPSQKSQLVLTPCVLDIIVAPRKDDHVVDTMAPSWRLCLILRKLSWKELGCGNPLFSFLFDSGSKEHVYHVWRLYSSAQDFIPLYNNDILKTGRATCWHNGMEVF